MDAQDRHRLSDATWQKVLVQIDALRSGRGRPGVDDRRFFEAVCWILRTGAPWRDLPREYGPWQTAYKRFSRWTRRGIWGAIYRRLRRKVQLPAAVCSLDSSSIRVHQHGAPKCIEREREAVGISRGGKTTKLHVLAFAGRHGVLLAARGMLSPGQMSDVAAAPQVLRALPRFVRTLAADKA